MPRNMSFALTTPQVEARIKTVTRRCGWWDLKPGDIVQAVEKGMGLRKGEKVRKLALIRIVSTRPEKLGRMAVKPYGTIETTLEGYPPGSEKHDPVRFIEMFCKANGVDASEVVNRIEYEYLDGPTNENALDAADLRPRAGRRPNRKKRPAPQSGDSSADPPAAGEIGDAGPTA